MDNFVITIARGFGSGGKQIGLALSKQLGIPCYESQILSMASNYSGINKDLFFQVDEKLRGYHLIKRLMKSANKDDIVEPTDKSFISDVNLYNIQAKIIKELAKQQSCIIIGKCANHLLRDYENTVSVYIEAPRAFCVKNVIERLGVTEEEAHRMIYQTDRYRADYYKYYTGGETWTNPVLYDMALNSDRMGMDKCTELIIQYLKIKLGEDILGKKGTAENDKALKQLGLF
ncbi:cytidylate kinase-like family protein [Ruminococcus sp. AF17-6LB]|uniref:cytidylate kinase-like family protein n=1 Tax=unclassified Ruminococcus TaxID=2608920 RepID=UPI000E52714D|nr:MULTISPECIES: cytidylate kinase-like family protein [unclassified Ruminococcus]RGG74145.1 cytidylate kinase-like family protein [Ruminococcus sp. AF17-6LB]RGG75814.1 cytidylate kinase-like family protein [Ruminococcus sp. AF17-6]RGG76156.1 cytidylate kinase-like family protein [Ruminococcus sp. AF17-24]RGG82659.1 cytidylate kinase-like family protein [Ruminococcus sp. AF17-1AC]